MPLGTLDRTPPPFFRQGVSAASKVIFFAALALFLMVADSRFHYAQPLRSGLAMALLPIERSLSAPVELIRGGSDYARGLNDALAGEKKAKLELTAQSAQLARAEQLSRENERLRALLDLQPALSVKSQSAQVLYEAPDPFSRRVFIDRGQTQGVKRGSPVIDPQGVIGQVTRVYALTSEVTLLADKDAAIPVLNQRTGQRAAAFGGAGGASGAAMELRFTSANADVQTGDLMTTSGLDGVYPPGLPVAHVQSVERRVESGFARIVLAPVAKADNVRFVLVLEPISAQLPARPEAPAVEAPLRGERAERAARVGRPTAPKP